MPCTSYGRQGRRGGSPKREKKTKGDDMVLQRARRRKLAVLCRERWRDRRKSDSRARIPPFIVKQLKAEVATLKM